jgi:peptidoglycan/LPS O-acetylase OafA/YrhL
LSESLSSFLNFSRWSAALLVLVNHARHLILVDLEEVKQKTLFVKALYFVTGLGHEAVVIFFVISGYLVGGVTLDRWLKDGPALRSYAAARFSRIYTTLIPVLIGGFLLDQIGMHWVNAGELYTDPAKYHTISLDNTLSGTINVRTLIGNLFMLQGILVNNLGTNSPLWSLSYEWWYYCLFACGAAALIIETRIRFAFGAAAIVLSALLPMKILLWGVIWLLGIAGYAWVKHAKWRLHPGLGLFVLTIAMAISRLSHNAHNVENPEPMLIEFVRDLGLGFAFILALAGISRLKREMPLARMHRLLADFSYTTYLVHFPILMFLTALAFQFLGIAFRVQPSGWGLLYLACLAGGIYACSFLISTVTEAHTRSVRRWVAHRLGDNRLD